MIFNKYISNKEIDVPEDDWFHILSEYSQEEIIADLSNEILSGNIRLPTRIITYEQMKESFIQLMNYHCNGIQYSDKVYTRYEYKYLLSGRYIDESNIGNTASDYFHQESRFYCDSINSPSPYRVWNNEKFLHSALSALFTLKTDSLNMQVLRTCLHLRKYVASQFKPSIAKAIYKIFDAKDILDFSAGWGDRLCGFYACDSTSSYTGIDPNTRLSEGYNQQCWKYLKLCCKTKPVTIIHKPAEDVVFASDSFDTVFTSPPIFQY